MSDKLSELNEMSALLECSTMMRQIAGPCAPGSGVKAALLKVWRELPGWTYTRVRDVWYADERVRISGDELRQVERAARDAANEKAAKDELAQLRQRMERIETILAQEQAHTHRPMAD